ncbi:unnamed protein product [Heligmosomoides polygyrus]|uniref:Biogenesis of lysosome-related organelles complex 1 subunit 7 n=1 Tax=Heligmosomoides polygyrus TaxID=6339 RepID=A0A183F751_HELPZ|nr:unnamed protein product [Heligmosomoides polygyrus]
METLDGLLASPELVSVVKKANDSTAVPECVKKLLLAITSQLTAVLSENMSLRTQLQDIAKENEALKEKLRGVMRRAPVEVLVLLRLLHLLLDLI